MFLDHVRPNASCDTVADVAEALASGRPAGFTPNTFLAIRGKHNAYEVAVVAEAITTKIAKQVLADLTRADVADIQFKIGAIGLTETI